MSVPIKASEIGLTPGVWTIDPIHSTVEFLVKHLVISKVRGRFNEFAGTITIAESLLDSAVLATIQANSIFTGQEMRDNHLRSGDFLEIENFPEITFRSTSITANTKNYTLTGDLTMRGVTKEVTLELEFNGAGAHPQGGVRAGFSATGSLSRKDFGIEYNASLEGGGVLLSDKMTLEFEIQASSPEA